MEGTTRLNRLLTMLESEPGDAFLTYALALEYLKTGDEQMSLELLLWLKQNEPSYVATYYQLGKLYEARAKIEDAKYTFSLGIDVAKRLKDFKTKSELEEALWLLED